uniref:non-specific serine/threonine protein kinase n=1 Tax=Musa acuminata subsp. malaccensis TaxID=214687 RepID=A0A804KTI1_MUSAM|nr:PREDICTED: serine/threonine-protein kinase CDG1 isoform X2 [Musa acuminata subsp. malaccensis]
MSGALAAVLGGAAGAVALLGILIGLIRYFMLRNRSIARSSDTNSSELSVQEEQTIELAFQGARVFTLKELDAATKDFSNINLIGYGMFGEVNKGFLQDGTIVAIKRRVSAPSQEFIEEVCYLSSIRHRNLVRLLGYCQENDLQMLVYEYVSNGSVSTHLYGGNQVLSRKLEFKHRLSIAHGAAKDEDFIPKVADAGLRRLLNRTNGASPSSRVTTDDPFHDPEVKESGGFSLKSDVYSFGVFLMELLCGRDVRSDQRLIEWAQNYEDSIDISTVIDPRMVSSFTSEGMKEFLRLITWCLNPSSERRPSMDYVEIELQRIREKELQLTTVMGEGTTTVTLGSQLFRA